MPAFFEFAKEKEPQQVEQRNDSFVNRLYELIPNKRVCIRGLKLEKINFKKMMGNSNMRCSSDIAKVYDKLNAKYRHMLNLKDEKINNLRYIACKLRSEFSSLGYSDETVADMLVEYCYRRNKRYKQLLWFCYGYIILSNMEKNIKAKSSREVQCVDCGEWFEVEALSTKTVRCRKCQIEKDRERKRIWKQKQAR